MQLKGLINLNEFYLESGKREFEKGCFEKAIQWWEEGIKKNLINAGKLAGQIAESYYQLAKVCCRKGNWRDADTYMSRSLKYRPDNSFYRQVWSVIQTNFQDFRNRVKFPWSEREKLHGGPLLPAFEQSGCLLPLKRHKQEMLQPEVEAVYAVCAYKPTRDVEGRSPVSELVRRMKFQRGRDMVGPIMGKVMVEWMLREQQKIVYQLDMIIPVPSDKWRTVLRGFKITENLSLAFEKILGLPVIPNVLARRRGTRDLRGLDAKKRKLALRGSFAYSNLEIVKGRSVLLIDDVVTYGTTFMKCANVLLKSTPKNIYAFAFYKTEPS